MKTAVLVNDRKMPPKFQQIIPNCIKFGGTDSTWFAYAENESDAMKWITEVNQSLVRHKQYRASRFTIPTHQVKDLHPIFSGQYVFDPANSDSLEPLLKALGRNVFSIKLLSNKELEQKIFQNTVELVVETSVKTNLQKATDKTKETTKKIMGKVLGSLSKKEEKKPEEEEDKGSESVKTDTYLLDGTEQMRESDLLIKGKIKLRTFWSEDGKVLITQSDFNSKEVGPGSVIMNMYFQNSDTLVYAYSLKLGVGSAQTAVASAKRVFHKKK